MNDAVDVIRPWSIKAVSSRVADEVTAEARKMGLTTGQLLEKVWDAWKADGSPVKTDSLTEDQRTARIQAVASMMQGLAAIKTATGRASGRDVVMQEVWALDRRPPRVLIHNPSTELSTNPGDK